MDTVTTNSNVPVYSLEPDEVTGNTYFRLYNFNGTLPPLSDLLVPHRKDHYLIAFVRQAGSRQWIDMTPYMLKNNTLYFSKPGQVIVKEELKQLWSTGIAFTTEFLQLQENTSLSKLPLLQNPYGKHELPLTATDVLFVEDMLAKITAEYSSPGKWQLPMLSAYTTVLLTYLSRLYTTQFKDNEITTEKILLKNFQAKIEEHFTALHEVGAYASLLNISAGHLSEVIKTQSGRPAIKHIHERLLLEARRLLFHTNISLKEIAFTLGFSDASYFNRFFKREAGITPAGYRVSIRKMYQ